MSLTSWIKHGVFVTPRLPTLVFTGTMWPNGVDWISKCVQLAVAAAVVAFAKLTWFHLRGNVVLRRQLKGPSESLLFGAERNRRHL